MSVFLTHRFQDGIESPVLPVGEGAAGVLTVHFDPTVSHDQ